MSMTMGMGLSQSIQLAQQIRLQLPDIQWSLLQAYQKGKSGPPPYVPPTFREATFEPRLKVERTRIAGFEALDHVAQMRAVDDANEIFRFAYTRGEKVEDGKPQGYYRIPLLRNFDVEIEEISDEITREEYLVATTLLAAVGEMERIARAVPYHELYTNVTAHLSRYRATLADTVLVSVDRGGRLPCMILQRALGLAGMESLKVNQGGSGDGLDHDKVEDFIARRVFVGKHVLFVDSTVDSGRQINALKRFFVRRQSELGFKNWSIVGSNDHGRSLDNHHMDINWGVDPDATFEDSPELMGIDYAPGSLDRIIERPCAASRAIRACLMSVPDGYIYDAGDALAEIARQEAEWKKHQSGRRKAHKATVKTGRVEHRKLVAAHRAQSAAERKHELFECLLARTTASRMWKKFSASPTALPNETFAAIEAAIAPAEHRNVLVIGNGKRQDLPATHAQFLADTLGPHCSFLAGTPDGNPGAVLNATLQSPTTPVPEVRLYQPQTSKRTNGSFGGAPVIMGTDKEDARRRMITDAHAVIVLGGNEGTLRELLMALDMGKPAVVIKGYGPVAEATRTQKRLLKKGLHVADSFAGAVQTLAELSAA